jgi:signal transduction histidine kinase
MTLEPPELGVRARSRSQRSALGDVDLDAVLEPLWRSLGAESAAVGRYEPDGTVTFLIDWRAAGAGSKCEGKRRLGGTNLVTLVAETGGAARMDSYEHASGEIGLFSREAGTTSGVATPIFIEGRLWGVMAATSMSQTALSVDTEGCLVALSELVATAIANAETRAALTRLAEEQAALRRVATLVARAVPQDQLFAAVTEEAGRLLAVASIHLCRYEPDRTAAVLGAWGVEKLLLDVGLRMPLGGRNVTTIVAETGRPARVDAYNDDAKPIDRLARDREAQAAVGVPIRVDAHLWGLLVAVTTAGAPLPANTQERLRSFTELVATAIGNAEGRAELTASRARIVTAGDEARKRIERDLHDGAQQHLVHAVIALKLALRAQRNGDSDAPQMVAEALRHAEEANSDLRELAHGILPAVLVSGGLRAGALALVSRLSLPVALDVTSERLPAPVEASAYFVISEALTNVVKHAGADRAEVIARIEGAVLRVQIRDHGAGGARTGPNTGLGGLDDRVAALGGRLEVESAPGHGTVVRALLPLAAGGTRDA